MGHKFTNYIALRQSTLMVTKRKRESGLTVSEQYELQIMDLLDGNFDDLADLQNIQIALAKALVIVSECATQHSNWE